MTFKPNFHTLDIFLVIFCIIPCIFGTGFVNMVTLQWVGGTENCLQSDYRGPYACTNGTDPGDWSGGMKYFQDNQKDLTYGVVQVNATLEGSFDCNEDVQVTIWLNKGEIGRIRVPQNNDPWCGICGNCWYNPGSLNITSKRYLTEGWPSYSYNHINEVLVVVTGVSDESRFCISQITLGLFFDQVPQVDTGSSVEHFELDAPTWFWTLVVLVAAIIVVLVIVFFTLWRRSSSNDGSARYRPVSTHEYIDPSQLEDIIIDSEQLVLNQEIGRGSFGQVFKGTWRGTEVAVKKIPAGCMQETEIREFMKEAFILRQLRHPNVLQVLGASMDPACIVMEFMPRGNLFNLIHDRNVPLPWPTVRKIALDVCRGLSYLHGCTPPLIHRDLKPHNLLVDENWRVKVCDFGLSRFIENKRDMTACGTPAYAAPEVLRNSDYTTSADVYSFAIVLWELITRDVVYPNMPPFQIIFTVGTQKSRPAIPPSIPAHIASLVRECWDEDPYARPSFEQITNRLFAIGDAW